MVKVLDFGIAKVRVEASVDALETQAGTVFGTPRYMSPEQAQGKDIDARSDLYTLGVLLYQMLVGRAPFVDDDAVVVMARHIKSTAVPPIEAAPDAGIGAALSALVMRALAKDPADRPASAQVFLAELDAAIAEDRRGLHPRGGAGTSGEVAAVTHDGLGASPARPPAPPAACRAPARPSSSPPARRWSSPRASSRSAPSASPSWPGPAPRSVTSSPPAASPSCRPRPPPRSLRYSRPGAAATSAALPAASTARAAGAPLPAPATVTVATPAPGSAAPASARKPIRGYKNMD